MNRIKLIAGVIMMARACSQSARADRREHPAYANGSDTDMAEVLEVEPITRRVRIEAPRRERWDGEIPLRHRAGYQNSTTPMIIAGIIGGVVGSRFGKGDGKTLMTFADARVHTEYTTRTRCTVRKQYHDDDRAEAYRTKYSYNGRVNATHIKGHPRDRLPVSVGVVPSH